MDFDLGLCNMENILKIVRFKRILLSKIIIIECKIYQVWFF